MITGGFRLPFRCIWERPSSFSSSFAHVYFLHFLLAEDWFFWYNIIAGWFTNHLDEEPIWSCQQWHGEMITRDERMTETGGKKAEWDPFCTQNSLHSKCRNSLKSKESGKNLCTQIALKTRTGGQETGFEAVVWKSNGNEWTTPDEISRAAGTLKKGTLKMDESLTEQRSSEIRYTQNRWESALIGIRYRWWRLECGGSKGCTA